MKTLKTTLFLLLLSSGLSLLGQATGEIKGTIIDKETGKSIPGANVWVYYGGELIGSASDLDGRFTLKPLQPGTYTLTSSFMGKDTIAQTITVKSGAVAFRDTIFLVEKSTVLGGYTVSETRFKMIDPYDVSKPSIGGEELKKMAVARNPVALIKSLGDGAFTDGGSGDSEIYYRGSRSNGITTYLDGMKISGTVPTYPTAAIKRVSVYTGGLPARYGDTTGGVIEIETKNFFDLYNQKVAQMGITYE